MEEKPLQVLLIEDNPGDFRLIQEMFKESRANVELKWAKQLSTGLANLKEEIFDGLLVDLGLPDSQGIDTFKKIHDQAPQIPIIVLTGLADDGLALRAVREGAQDYLIKGQTDSNLLIRTIHYAIERKRAEEETRLHENHLKNLLDLHRMGDAKEKEIFDFTLEAGLRAVPSEFAFVGIISADEAVMIIHAWSRGAMGQCAITEKPIHFPIAEAGLWGEIVRQRRPIIVNDYNTSTEFKKGYPEGHVPIKRFLGIPIFSADRIVAVAAVANKVSEYTESDVSSLTSLLHEMWNLIDRKQAEEALRKSEEKYRTILENIEDGYFEVDIAGNFTFFNDSLCQILGYSRDEMMGMNNRQYTDNENAPKLYQAFNKVYRTGEPAKGFDWEIIRKDGIKRYIEASVSLIKDSSGQPIGFRGIVLDITERKRAEGEKAILEEQLRQSQKIEAIGRLAGGIAHDFNNILTVIKGYSQLSLIELKEDVPLRGNIEEIKRAAERAADLTRQLLAFSRRQILEMKVLDLNTVLINLDKMLRRVISEDIELVMVLAEDLGRVKTDPGQIEQVIMNLAVNARDAMPNGGKLTIETANMELDEAYARSHVAVRPSRYVMFSVSDSGVGMSPEVRERVFEPFFTTKEKGKGTGLGLSTVYGIVKQSEGNIWVYSELDKGTTIKIYLPRVDEPIDETKKPVTTEDLPRGNETALVVEDEENVRKLTVRVLQRQGYNVLEASQGLDAFLICEGHEEPIHLLITDVIMPKMNGQELAERIVSIRPEIKVLYMSGYTDNTITHPGVLDKGMNYIQKPFTLEGLVRKVREVLDK